MLTLEEEIKRLEIQAGMLNPILYSNLIDYYMQFINWLKDYQRLLEKESFDISKIQENPNKRPLVTGEKIWERINPEVDIQRNLVKQIITYDAYFFGWDDAIAFVKRLIIEGEFDSLDLPPEKESEVSE